MAFEKTLFGDGSNAGSGNVVSTVHNQFGPRKGGSTVGVYETDGLVRELSIDIDGDMLGKAAFQLITPKLPKGAMIRQVLATVSEVFVLGASTTIRVGTSGSESTNGISLTEAQGEALGTYNLTSTLAGTWAVPLTAGVTVGIALAGGTTTTTTAGKARIVIRYDLISSK